MTHNASIIYLRRILDNESFGISHKLTFLAFKKSCFVGHVYNLKNSFKTNYWHFGGNRLLLLTKNENLTKNLGRALPPSFGQNPKEQ